MSRSVIQDDLGIIATNSAEVQLLPPAPAPFLVFGKHMFVER